MFVLGLHEPKMMVSGGEAIELEAIGIKDTNRHYSWHLFVWEFLTS